MGVCVGSWLQRSEGQVLICSERGCRICRWRLSLKSYFSTSACFLYLHINIHACFCFSYRVTDCPGMFFYITLFLYYPFTCVAERFDFKWAPAIVVVGMRSLHPRTATTLFLAVATARVGGHTRADWIETTPLTIRRYELYRKHSFFSFNIRWRRWRSRQEMETRGATKVCVRLATEALQRYFALTSSGFN